MKCPSCGYQNAESSRFCVSCGSRLQVPESLNQTARRSELESYRSQLRELQEELDRVLDALEAHGIRVSGPEPQTPPPLHAGPPTIEAELAPPPDVPQVEETRAEEHSEPIPSPARPAGSPVYAARAGLEAPDLSGSGGYDVPPGRRREPAPPAPIPIQTWLSELNWEPIIGGNWLARIGVLAIVIGVGFFLRLAFENEWINETGRIGLGLLAGLAFLCAGEYWRKKYPVYSQALSGAGIAVSYLSIFAAYALYGLIGIFVGAGGLLLVSAVSALLALRHNSMGLAVIGVIGAFFGPFILHGFSDSNSTTVESSASNAFWLLAYILLVDIGVIALSTFRNWSWFTALALAGSLSTFGLWCAHYLDAPNALISEYNHNGALQIAHAALTGIFLSFVAATTLYQLAWKRDEKLIGVSIILANAVIYAGISYRLLWTDFRDWMGLFTFSVALLYGGLGLLAYHRIGIKSVDLENPLKEVPLTLILFGVAVIFLTVAIPVQIGGPWVPAAWTVEALVLTWISFNRQIPDMRMPAYLIFGAALGWLLVVDTPEAFRESLTPFANRYLPEYLVVIAGLWLAAFLFQRNRKGLLYAERNVLPAAMAAGVAMLGLGTAVQLRTEWLPMAWALEASVLIWLAFNPKLSPARYPALLILAAAGSWLLIEAPSAFDEIDTPFLNMQLPAYLVVVGTAWLAAWRFHGARTELKKEERAIPEIMGITGVALLALGTAVQVRDEWLPVAWSLEALAICRFSISYRQQQFTIAALLMVVPPAIWLLITAPDAIKESPTPFLNMMLPAYLIFIASLWVFAFWFNTNRAFHFLPIRRREEENLVEFLAVAGLVFLALGTVIQVEGPWLAFSWSIEGLAITWVSMRIGMRAVQLSSLVLFGAASFRAVVADSVVDGDGYTVLLNTRLVAFAPVIAGMAIAAYLWRSASKNFRNELANVSMGLVVTANAAALWFLSAEVIGAVQADAVVTVRADDEFDVISLGLTVLWGAYGGAVLTAGFIGGWRAARAGGLLLLAVPVFKLFLFDSFQLDQAFRVAAFLLLGAILLIGGYLYQRHSETFRELFLPQLPDRDSRDEPDDTTPHSGTGAAPVA